MAEWDRCYGSNARAHFQLHFWRQIHSHIWERDAIIKANKAPHAHPPLPRRELELLVWVKRWIFITAHKKKQLLSSYSGYIKLTLHERESGFNDEVFDSFHKLRVAESLDQMDMIARKHSGNPSMAKTSRFPEEKWVICSRSVVMDVILTVSAKSQPSGLPAFYFLQIRLVRQELHSQFLALNHTALIDLHRSSPLQHLAVRITDRELKWAAEQKLGYDETRWASRNHHSRDPSQLRQTQPRVFYFLKLH